MKHHVIFKLLLSVLALTCMGATSCNIKEGFNSQSNVASVQDMVPTMVPKDVYYLAYTLQVSLTPITAKANTVYSADLYEKGVYRASMNVEWDQPQINVAETTTVQFPLTKNEYEAYYSASLPQTLHEASEQLKGAWHSSWWKPIFSIKISEILPVTTTQSQTTMSGIPSITFTYPKGGEIWHVGDTVTITWTSTNLPVDTPITIYILSSNGKDNSITGSQGVHNTGSYQWTIPNSVAGNSIIGTHERIDTIITGARPYSPGNGSASSAYFTIKN